MSKKVLVEQLKVKLDRLKQLEKSETYQHSTLNPYANYLNDTLDALKINAIGKVRLLTSSDNSFASSGPSTTEIAIMNELISKYSDILIFINPDHGKAIIHEFKDLSNRFKLLAGGINLAVLFACGTFFYNQGKDYGNSSKEIQVKEIASQTDTIRMLRDTIYTIQKKTIIASKIDTSQKMNSKK